MSSTPGDLALALRRLLDGTARFTGPEFFAALARTTAEVFDVPVAFVGEFVPPATMRAIAVWADGAPGVPFDYALPGTPCSTVVDRGQCQYPAGVQQRFPEDTMLVEMGINAYFAIPVLTASDEVLGIVVALDRIPREFIADLDVVLGAFAARAATEIERLRGVAAVTRSEGRLRQIVDTTMEGVWVIDHEARTTLVNRPMAAMLGYEPDEMLGQPMFAFMDERSQAQARLNVDRRRRGISERHEFRLRHKHGADVWVVMATNPLMDVTGTYQGALAMVSDTTERRSLELKVQHAQKLESLGVLAGGIAHDFNNLLVGVLGNVGLALRQTRAESTLAPVLEDIQTAALRAADLTRQLLAYSGRGRFVIEPISLNGIVEEMVHLLGTVISKKAALTLELGYDLPLVEADATQLRQVVMNLVTNASDALDDRTGAIAISTGVRVVTAADLTATYLDDELPEGRYVFLEVTDTGVGMDAATRERIFDPFFTTKFTGRGLGLAATLGILRGHRGTIKVTSEPGRGASFRVLLPARANQAEPLIAPAPPAGPAPPVSALIVLVVDDEPLIRAIATKVLQHSGYVVIVAGDGEEAVAIFTARADEIACVLLDMTMPKLNGEETLAALRRLRPRVPVVLSSGYSEQEATPPGVAATATGFVAKPWTAEILLAAVARAIAVE